jgi:hypothetical protein
MPYDEPFIGKFLQLEHRPDRFGVRIGVTVPDAVDDVSGDVLGEEDVDGAEAGLDGALCPGRALVGGLEVHAHRPAGIAEVLGHDHRLRRRVFQGSPKQIVKLIQTRTTRSCGA